MNHFNCPHSPFTCDHSIFLEDNEDNIESDGKVRRWVECVDYYYAEDPNNKKMRWFESKSHTLVVDGSAIVIKKGDLCVNCPCDWWEEYKERGEK